jgi:hypothetical protein
MALIFHCVEQYAYAVTVLNLFLEYADDTSERAGVNFNLVSRLKFFTKSNESIFTYLFFDEIYDSVIDGNRTAAEADHILHAPRIIDPMKHPASIKVRKDVTSEQWSTHISITTD